LDIAIAKFKKYTPPALSRTLPKAYKRDNSVYHWGGKCYIMAWVNHKTELPLFLR